MIALKDEVAFASLCKVLHLGEFARGDTLLKVIAAEHVFEIFHAIDRVNAFVRSHEQAEVVPFTGRLCGIERLVGLRINLGLVETVESTAALRDGRFLIVF